MPVLPPPLLLPALSIPTTPRAALVFTTRCSILPRSAHCMCNALLGLGLVLLAGDRAGDHALHIVDEVAPGSGVGVLPLLRRAAHSDVAHVLHPDRPLLVRDIVLVREPLEVPRAADEGEEGPEEDEEEVARGEEQRARERDQQEHQRSPRPGAGPADKHPEGGHAEGHEEGAEDHQEQARGSGEADDIEDIAERIHDAREADVHEHEAANSEVGPWSHHERLSPLQLRNPCAGWHHILEILHFLAEVLIAAHQHRLNFGEKKHDPAHHKEAKADGHPDADPRSEARVLPLVSREVSNRMADVERLRAKSFLVLSLRCVPIRCIAGQLNEY
mmetsp:Transcript_46661/g.110617  ORF Transcript_46661/g.110617 Transcript_46661/m.110617 type:complete len:331 (-) Transcript_46661:78-1070(-)